MGNRRNINMVEKLRSTFFGIAGWLIPLVASAPSLFIWAGLMTLGSTPLNCGRPKCGAKSVS